MSLLFYIKISTIISLLIGILIEFYILYWLDKMNKCPCSSDLSEKKYLYEWFIFMIIWSFIYGILFLIYDAIIPSTLNIINSIIVFIHFIMFVRLFIYLKKLKETKCDCGTLRQLNTIYYYLIIVFSMLAFVVFITLIGSILSSIFADKKKPNLNKNKSIK